MGKVASVQRTRSVRHVGVWISPRVDAENPSRGRVTRRTAKSCASRKFEIVGHASLESSGDPHNEAPLLTSGRQYRRDR